MLIIRNTPLCDEKQQKVNCLYVGMKGTNITEHIERENV